MYKFIIALFIILLNSEASFAIPPSLRLAMKESTDLLASRGRAMTSSTVQVLRGSRPTKPLSEAPFEKVDKLFNRPIQFLDNSGEVFRRQLVTPAAESFIPKLEQVDRETVKVDLKKKQIY